MSDSKSAKLKNLQDIADRINATYKTDNHNTLAQDQSVLQKNDNAYINKESKQAAEDQGANEILGTLTHAWDATDHTATTGARVFQLFKNAIPFGPQISKYAGKAVEGVKNLKTFQDAVQGITAGDTMTIANKVVKPLLSNIKDDDVRQTAENILPHLLRPSTINDPSVKRTIQAAITTPLLNKIAPDDKEAIQRVLSASDPRQQALNEIATKAVKNIPGVKVPEGATIDHAALSDANGLDFNTLRRAILSNTAQLPPDVDTKAGVVNSVLRNSELNNRERARQILEASALGDEDSASYKAASLYTKRATGILAGNAVDGLPESYEASAQRQGISDHPLVQAGRSIVDVNSARDAIGNVLATDANGNVDARAKGAIKVALGDTESPEALASLSDFKNMAARNVLMSAGVDLTKVPNLQLADISNAADKVASKSAILRDLVSDPTSATKTLQQGGVDYVNKLYGKSNPSLVSGLTKAAAGDYKGAASDVMDGVAAQASPTVQGIVKTVKPIINNLYNGGGSTSDNGTGIIRSSLNSASEAVKGFAKEFVGEAKKSVGGAVSNVLGPQETNTENPTIGRIGSRLADDDISAKMDRNRERIMAETRQAALVAATNQAAVKPVGSAARAASEVTATINGPQRYNLHEPIPADEAPKPGILRQVVDRLTGKQYKRSLSDKATAMFADNEPLSVNDVLGPAVHSGTPVGSRPGLEQAGDAVAAVGNSNSKFGGMIDYMKSSIGQLFNKSHASVVPEAPFVNDLDDLDGLSPNRLNAAVNLRDSDGLHDNVTGGSYRQGVARTVVNQATLTPAVASPAVDPKVTAQEVMRTAPPLLPPPSTNATPTYTDEGNSTAGANFGTGGGGFFNGGGITGGSNGNVVVGNANLTGGSSATYTEPAKALYNPDAILAQAVPSIISGGEATISAAKNIASKSAASNSTGAASDAKAVGGDVANVTDAAVTDTETAVKAGINGGKAIENAAASTFSGLSELADPITAILGLASLASGGFQIEQAFTGGPKAPPPPMENFEQQPLPVSPGVPVEDQANNTTSFLGQDAAAL